MNQRHNIGLFLSFNLNISCLVKFTPICEWYIAIHIWAIPYIDHWDSMSFFQLKWYTQTPNIKNPTHLQAIAPIIANDRTQSLSTLLKSNFLRNCTTKRRTGAPTFIALEHATPVTWTHLDKVSHWHWCRRSSEALKGKFQEQYCFIGLIWDAYFNWINRHFFENILARCRKLQSDQTLSSKFTYWPFRKKNH